MRVGAEDRNLQANGTLLHGDGGGGDVGAVVVLNDVTRLKRLEAVRRDFVANVSHELKTPVTSIKGFAETLYDGALDDPDAAQRFVRIIAGQADRLNSIIEDLLALSTLEQSADSPLLQLEEADLCDVVAVALEVCGPKAEAKGVVLREDVPRTACSRASARRCSSRPWSTSSTTPSSTARRAARSTWPSRRPATRSSSSVQRRGPRHRARAPAAPLRALLPRRQGAQPRPRRHGPRPRDRQAHRPDPRRPRLRGQRRRRAAAPSASTCRAG